MKKTLVALGAVFALALAAAVSFRVVMSRHAVQCQKGEGREAIDACAWAAGHSFSDFYKLSFLVLRARHLYKAGEAAEALADMNAALPLLKAAGSEVPKEMAASIYEDISIYNNRLDRRPDSYKYADLAIAAGSVSHRAYMIRAAGYAEAGRYREALGDLGKAEELGHPMGLVWAARGLAYRSLGDHARAYENYLQAERALGQDPAFAATLNKDLGLEAYSLGRWQEALGRLQRAETSGVNCPECPAAMAACLKALAPPPAKKRRRSR
jgi:tetratricopeptide (TPR) repeat protein